MPVSGLVVSLCGESGPRSESLDAIQQHSQITVGALQANRLAIVLDTSSSEEDREVLDWLSALPAVSMVEVAFVAFEPSAESQPSQLGTAATDTQQ